MKRKIIKQGVDSYTVTLPIKWIRHIGLENGSEINIETEGDKIEISPDEISVDRPLTIESSQLDEPNIWFLLQQAYRSGATKITMQNLPKKHFATVEDALDRSFEGLEISEYKNDGVVIEVTMKITEQTFDVLVRKIFHIMEQSIQALLDGEYKRLHKLTDNCRKSQQLCKRTIINKQSGYRSYEHYSMLTQIYTAQTCLRRYSDRKKLDANDKEVLTNLLDIVEKISNAYFGNTADELYQTQVEIKKLFDSEMHGFLFACINALYGAHSPMIGILAELTS